MENFNLYKRYCEEKLNRKFYELPEGFISYDIRPPEVYIADLYVIPEMRMNGIGKKLFLNVLNDGKDAGCKFVSCKVELDRMDPELSMAAIIAVGFKFKVRSNNDLYFVKEIL